MKKLFLSTILLLCICGCVRSLDDQGRTTYHIDPNEAMKYEKPVEAAATVLEALAPFVPYAGTGAVALLTALGIWKAKIKPQYTKAKTEANLYHTTARTVVAVIEDIKLKDSELWKKLKPFLEDSQMGKNVTNAILALRGKPPVE